MSYSNTSKLLNLVKLSFLPIYSPLCDASCGNKFVEQVTTWPEELSDNYTVVSVYYNTETVDINVDCTHCKTFPVKDVRRIFEFGRGTVRLDYQLLSSCGWDQ